MQRFERVTSYRFAGTTGLRAKRVLEVLPQSKGYIKAEVITFGALSSKFIAISVFASRQQNNEAMRETPGGRS
eukprot:4593553-Pleurochrysis_carterae.AAC.1